MTNRFSRLAKRHNVKTFPVPTASHDPGDVWGWHAGYCRAKMPMPRATVHYHYRVASDHARSLRQCKMAQKKEVPELLDYVRQNRNDTGKYVVAETVYAR